MIYMIYDLYDNNLNYNYAYDYEFRRTSNFTVALGSLLITEWWVKQV